tara:strand:- start:445 stop:558 length:114 start_codon:yes stop_codon:yes gene_type:complete
VVVEVLQVFLPEHPETPWVEMVVQELEELEAEQVQIM